MFEIIFGIWDAIEPVVVPLLITVGAATGISIFTPNSHSSRILDMVLRILNAVAGNVHKNKNKDDR